MKLLVIDTSGPVCGTAVMDEEKVYSEFTAQNRNTHSTSLMPMIEAALKAAGTELKELDPRACPYPRWPSEYRVLPIQA